MSALETLFPAAASLEIDGVTLEVAPLRLGELPQALALLRRLELPALASGEAFTANVLQLLEGDSGETLLNLVALLARRPRAWVDTLPLDAAIRLTAALIEVNADFFGQRVLPALLTGLGGLTATPGPIPSST